MAPRAIAIARPKEVSERARTKPTPTTVARLLRNEAAKISGTLEPIFELRILRSVRSLAAARVLTRTAHVRARFATADRNDALARENSCFGH